MKHSPALMLGWGWSHLFSLQRCSCIRARSRNVVYTCLQQGSSIRIIVGNIPATGLPGDSIRALNFSVGLARAGLQQTLKRPSLPAATEQEIPAPVAILNGAAKSGNGGSLLC